ncbi:hypothetical protein LCGC14_2804740, partial [marine sediment metagenome]
MLPDSEILCELHCQEEDATQIKTLLNAADERLLLTVFAVPRWDGYDWNEWSDEDNDLCELMVQMARQGFSVAHALAVTADFV